MKTILILIFPFLLSLASEGQGIDSNDSLYTILRTGAPTRRSQIASQVSSKFGFEYKYIGYNNTGGIISPPNLDSMQKLNELTYKLIAKKYGNGWQEKFNKEVDRTYKNWGNIKDFLDSDTTFENLLQKLTLEKYGDFRILKEIQANKVFIIEYTFYDREKHIVNSKRVFKVNLSRLEVSITSDH